MEQPSRNLLVGRVVQYVSDTLEELPDDPGQHPTSRQLTGRGLDQLRDGVEGVGHLGFWLWRLTAINERSPKGS